MNPHSNKRLDSFLIGVGSLSVSCAAQWNNQAWKERISGALEITQAAEILMQEMKEEISRREAERKASIGLHS